MFFGIKKILKNLEKIIEYIYRDFKEVFADELDYEDELDFSDLSERIDNIEDSFGIYLLYLAKRKGKTLTELENIEAKYETQVMTFDSKKTQELEKEIANLKKEDIRVDDKGSVTIVKPRHKTGVTFYSVVLKDGVEVLKKYDYNIPKISNQVGNRLLHIIEGICGTSTPITFHRCRHYYCTQLIASGVPLSIVQKCMGHSKALMTMHYTHLVEDDVKKEVLNKLK